MAKIWINRRCVFRLDYQDAYYVLSASGLEDDDEFQTLITYSEPELAIRDIRYGQSGWHHWDWRQKRMAWTRS